MTDINTDGIRIPAINLKTLTPGADDHGRVFNHIGIVENEDTTITLVDGNTTDEEGLYIWDNDLQTWRVYSGDKFDATKTYYHGGLG